MTCYQRFPDLPTAQAAFARAECRRHVEIDGHVIDLLQAAREAGRVREEPVAVEPDQWPYSDADVAFNVAEYFALARRDPREGEAITGCAESVLSELAQPDVPAVERCPWCNGEVGR